MLRVCTRILFCIGALLATLPVQAAIIKLEAELTRNQEPLPGSAQPLVTNPGGASRPTSFGSAVFYLDTTPGAEKMSMIVTVFNIDVGRPVTDAATGCPTLPGCGIPAGGGQGTQTPGDANDDLVAAHIHVGAGIPGISNSPVRWGFWGSPYNNTDLDGVMGLFGSGAGGTFTGEWDALEGNGTTLVAQIPDILAGRAYINYHTGQFGGGEIRGQLVLPEPGTIALLGIAALGFFGLRRRRA